MSPAQVYAGTAHTTDTSRTDISAVAGRNTRCGAVDGKVECIVISTVDIQYLHIYYLISPVQEARVACCGETPATVVVLVADTGAGEAGLHIGGVEVRVSAALPVVPGRSHPTLCRCPPRAASTPRSRWPASALTWSPRLVTTRQILLQRKFSDIKHSFTYFIIYKTKCKTKIYDMISLPPLRTCSW